METGGAGCVPWARSNPTIECCARGPTMDQLFHSAVQLGPTLTPSRVRGGRDETTALGGGQARKRQFSFEANTHAASARWEGADLRQITPERPGRANNNGTTSRKAPLDTCDCSKGSVGRSSERESYQPRRQVQTARHSGEDGHNRARTSASTVTEHRPKLLFTRKSLTVARLASSMWPLLPRGHGGTWKLPEGMSAAHRNRSAPSRYTFTRLETSPRSGPLTPKRRRTEDCPRGRHSEDGGKKVKVHPTTLQKPEFPYHLADYLQKMIRDVQRAGTVCLAKTLLA